MSREFVYCHGRLVACVDGWCMGCGEIHKWIGCMTKPRAKWVSMADGNYLNNAIQGIRGDPDIHWLSFHGGTKTPNTY